MSRLKKLQGPSTKHQAPEKLQRPKSQIPNLKLQIEEDGSILKFGALGFWDLMFLWSLVLGTWSFSPLRPRLGQAHRNMPRLGHREFLDFDHHRLRLELSQNPIGEA